MLVRRSKLESTEPHARQVFRFFENLPGIDSHGGKIRRIEDDGVVVEDGTGREIFIQADTVVLGVGMNAKTEEVKKLREAAGSIPVFEIGDCVRAAKIGEAVQEGYRAAMSII